MIDVTHIVDNINNLVGVWCPTVDDNTELARVVSDAVAGQVSVLSVVPGVVKTVWPWVENSDVDIVARFFLAPGNKVQDVVISDLVKNIKSAFKHGASGAQIFVGIEVLSDFVDEIMYVRDDLFFNKTLALGLDICEINSDMWNMVFDCLIKLRVDSVVFVLSKDTGKKSDFVGRVFAMLNCWNNLYDGSVFWMLNDKYVRIEQAIRLTHSIRPNLVQNTGVLVRDLGRLCRKLV